MADSENRTNIIGQSNALLATLEHLSQVAPLNKPILLIGERGTGKELFAERLHYLSARWEQELIKVNCAALSENLLESELFGHEGGAFTGAKGKRAGRFERAHQGTLFLDELATTSSLVQEKLLRVIEYGEFERLGGSQTLYTDVRLICATNEDLPSLVAQGKFRADLLDRLAFDVITLPPLRYRQKDIPVLAEHFAISMTKQLQREFFSGFSEQALKQLHEYPWPGNIRELKNVIERAVYRQTDIHAPLLNIQFDPFASPYRPLSSPDDTASTPEQRPLAHHSSAHHSNAHYSNAPAASHSSIEPSNSEKISFPLDFKAHTQAQEKQLIEQALQQAQFNQKQAAELLTLTYHQLRGLLKKYQLL